MDLHDGDAWNRLVGSAWVGLIFASGCLPGGEPGSGGSSGGAVMTSTAMEGSSGTPVDTSTTGSADGSATDTTGFGSTSSTSSVETSASTTIEGTSASDDGDSSGDPGPPAGPYSPCDPIDLGCPGNEACFAHFPANGLGAAVCVESCNDDRDCVEPSSGTATAACVGVGMPMGVCLVLCLDPGSMCPDGMACIDDFLCYWPVPPPDPQPGGSCCTASAQPGCDVQAIETCVCDINVFNPDCCDGAWDETCVQQAEEVCNAQC